MKSAALIILIFLILFVAFGGKFIPEGLTLAGVNLNSSAKDTKASLGTVSAKAAQEVLAKNEEYSTAPGWQPPPRPQGSVALKPPSTNLGGPASGGQVVLAPPTPAPTIPPLEFLPTPTLTAVRENETAYTSYGVEVNFVSTDQKLVTFTFDAGSPGLAGNEVLAVLEGFRQELGFNTTIFVTGKWSEANVAQLQKISQLGFEVGNHTYSHPDLTQLAANEVELELIKTEQVVRAITGVSTKPFWRAPFGARSEELLQSVFELGWTHHIYWTIDSGDWREDEQGSQENVVRRVQGKVEPGAIIVMHLGGKNTAGALEELIPQLYSEGYQFVSISDLIKAQISHQK